MRVLIVEDDLAASEHLARGLREQGHVVDEVADGMDGLVRAGKESYDALVLDRMLPSLDGLTLIETLRKTGKQTPALIVSALGDVDERVRGLRAGGDDYLVKPYAFAELLARLEALQRRGASSPAVTRLAVGDLALDLLARRVTRAGVEIPLQTREFQLLEFLVRHAGQVVTRTMLLESVWGYSFDPQTNVIDVHVSRLRKKLGPGSGGPLIHTVHGAGYTIRGPA